MQEPNVGCPGVDSDKAGKSSSCEGCPNRTICSSGVSRDESNKLVAENLAGVQNKLLILSGKGGVGKSTVTMLLTKFLAQKYKQLNFAVLDLDICGPSQPRMLGVENELVHQSGSGWSPVHVEENICLMSIGFLLSSPDEALVWRGPKKNGMIQQFLSQVDWGDVDFLILDTPPGTSDEHLSATTYLKNDDTIKALIITTPQEVSLLDVRKEISFCKKVKIPIIGVIENMSLFVCGHCKKSSEIFPAKTGGAEAMCKEMDVPFLGKLPMDPEVTKLCDKGGDIENLNEQTLSALENICNNLTVNL